ncbi:hypothetical protein J3U99_02445 [Brucella pituitosa]|uniref:hypothetical protein n=1 Tax=Brucella TaxID=234 RepID=UPI0004648900|nr:MULTISPECIES: hypothetical protein [Brucella]PQZ51569.1 hypothetical protein CQZ90_01900 [Ochrobactrum sp. MYb19]PRA56233.1 hypothetical protein CQ062_06005 [Ochrobactrum sp. MYb68]PRA65399.1 hypothetical protein CQ053_10520 [Ochrobactrum sp. MYb18]PRA77089.1 hypothetical protein CQ049_06995 [Brucella thiophenivorans]PRA88033.1 hypothetical protein CQ054_06510 [Ochrobactrum sp. MYb29]PRA93278.1 hypothetical protein CQ051_01900 [Ochrobactrum sp. MYb14]PRA99098.1 hypothetical protein CQ052_
MMLVVFAALALSLIFAWFGRQSIAIFLVIVCLALGVKQFLWEIYSPEYGFRMPWLQTQIIDLPQPHQFAYDFTPNTQVHGEAA